jgi:hypothetical protein
MRERRILDIAQRSALLTQGWDSELRGFSVFHLFRWPVHKRPRHRTSVFEILWRGAGPSDTGPARVLGRSPPGLVLVEDVAICPMLLEAARRIGLFLTTCLLTLGAPTAHQAAFASGDVNRVMTAASAARRRVGRILFSLVPLLSESFHWEPSFHLGIFWQPFRLLGEFNGTSF